MDRGTYVYCLIADRTPADLRGVARGLPGLGRVRLLPIDGSNVSKSSSSRDRLLKYLVVADAPLDRYGESEINDRMSNLEWVSRAAIAHEAVIESFARAAAVLPMKLLTIFRGDQRALEYVASNRRHIESVLRRVIGHEEWGVRVALGRSIGAPASRKNRGRPSSQAPSRTGSRYLEQKKARRDAATELAVRSRQVVSDLFDRLNALSGAATRRSLSDLPMDGPLLLDAAFLVSRRTARRFRGEVERRARMLARTGYLVSLTGPWPAYSFMQD